jgi:hypothetical protein
MIVALSAMNDGPAAEAFLIFHSSECSHVVNVPGDKGFVADERPSHHALTEKVSMQTKSATRQHFDPLTLMFPGVEILLAAGHVRVTPGSADKRHVLVELTAAGRATTLRLVKSNAARLRQTFGAFTDPELQTLVDLLLRLNASLER